MDVVQMPSHYKWVYLCIGPGGVVHGAPLVVLFGRAMVLPCSGLAIWYGSCSFGQEVCHSGYFHR